MVILRPRLRGQLSGSAAELAGRVALDYTPRTHWRCARNWVPRSCP